jgi:endonuclease YncB( thermonuclease family)
MFRPSRTFAFALLLALCAVGCEPGLRAGLSEGRAVAGPIAAEGLPMVCTVHAVVDGDTLSLVCSGKQLKVRLHCIDAPEMGQGHWGRAAREHLVDMTPRTVVVMPKRTERGYRDRFGRIVGEVLTPDSERRNLGMAQVVSGKAAVYPRYCGDERYFWVESVAKQAHAGIWRLPGGQQTPWAWRHRG